MNYCQTMFAAILAFSIQSGVTTNAVAQEEIKLGDRRIVGGERTSIQEHPWQVAITIKRPDGTYLCGGSIIAEKWIVSAAHCFRPADSPDSVKVKAGKTNYVDEGIWSQIERVVIHEKYNPATNENDIALVKLRARPAGSIIARGSQTPPVGEPLEVTGWGTTTEDGEVSKLLLKATVPYVDNATCNESASYGGRVLSTMMCAGRREGGIDSCQGDSGGPLVWTTNGTPVLVGVVSFGDGCARRLKYGVYTRLSSYLGWVDRVLAADHN